MDSSIIARVLDLAVAIQQVPAKTFEEHRRAEFIHAQFIHSGIDDSFMDDVGNVYACIRGRGDRQPLVLSAHLDTVFPSETDLTISRSPVKIAGPGIGDNSLGLAGLLGLIWSLTGSDASQPKREPLPGDLWLVANVAEEGLGNLKGMKAVVDRFGNAVTAYIILEGMSLGQIYHRGLGVRRYRISVNTRGGHSWVDHGNPSATHILGELIVGLTHLPLPVEPRTSLNVGVIAGGTSVNTIASQASLELDLRSVSPKALEDLSRRVEKLVGRADQVGGEGLKVNYQVIGDRPAGEISAEHPLVKLAVNCNEDRGVKVRLNIGSTDTNEPLSRGIPAICVGLTTGGGAHTIEEFIDTWPVAQGMQILENLVRSVFLEGISRR